ncbi:hypothetical protein ACFC0M_06575 [Streptomyces sp. NPDC056149]|uniref:hypothetical protein n=1 Tax=Streptomyces sp. NPDC056149 TaxID=3345728 RepID=UPI0035E32072
MPDSTPNTPPTHTNKPTRESLAGLTSAAAAVYTELLGLTEPITVAELAHAASIGHSTAGRAVATLENLGLAVRAPGGHDGPRRMPDLWQPTPDTPAPNTTDTAEHKTVPPQEMPKSAADDPAQPADNSTEDQDAPTDDDLSDSTPSTAKSELPIPEESAVDEPTPSPAKALASRSTESEISAPCADPPRSPKHHDGESAGSGEPDVNTKDGFENSAPQPPLQSPPGKNGRLAPGALRQMVIDHLQARPDEAFTATRISRAIERSSGAIANALVKLVATGVAKQVTDQPRTYQLTQPNQTNPAP